MKKIEIRTVGAKAICILMACIFALVSCDIIKTVDFGFPKKVTFPKEGGVQYFRGKRTFFSITILDHDAFSRTIDGISGTCDWLTVESPANDKTLLILTAAPCDDENPRELTLRFDDYGEYIYYSEFDTVVEQK